MKIKILLFSLFASASLSAQIIPRLDKFEIQDKEGIVFLNWVFSSGSVCLGIQIERSEDSINFYEIGNIAGFCGSLTKPMSFSYQDESPIYNRKIFYRLTYPDLGHSEIIGITVNKVTRNDYEANPTPSFGLTKLNYFNPKGERHILKVCNLSGLEVMQLETNENFFEIDASELDAGLYQFRISNESQTSTVSGRLLIAR